MFLVEIQRGHILLAVLALALWLLLQGRPVEACQQCTASSTQYPPAGRRQAVAP